MRTEEVFAVALPDEECAQIRTVGDLYALVLAKLELPYVPSSEVEREPLGIVVPLSQTLKLSRWTAPDVWLMLKALIHEQLGIKTSRIIETAKFLDDLGCD